MVKKVLKYIIIIILTVAVILFGCYRYYIEKTPTKPPEIKEVKKEQQLVTKLNLAIAEFDTINPIQSTNKNVQDIAQLIYEPLFSVDSNFQLQNCLVQEYSKVDAKTYLIKLKENIKWHNGDSLKSKDISDTIELIRKTKKSIYQENIKPIKEVKIIDELTFQIILKQEVPFYEYQLIFPIIKENTNGTGLYVIKELGENIVLEKNTDYWNKEKNPILQKIVVKLYDNIGEVYNAFKLGNVDLINTNNLNYSEYIGQLGFNVKESVGREYNYLAFNQKNKILQDKSVRKAISYSINKPVLASKISNNNYYVSNFPLDYSSWLYNGQIVNKYDMDKAISILEEAGWSYEDEKWKKGSNTLAFDIIVDKENSMQVKIAEEIKRQLDKVGIKISIKSVSNKMYNMCLQNKNYDIILDNKIISFSPNLEWYFGQNNLGNYKNEECQEVIQEVRNITEPSKLQEKYKILIEAYQEDVPYISLCSNKMVLLYSENLYGDITPNWYQIFYNIETWKILY